MKRRRTYSREFKISVLHELESGKTKAQLSREHGIDHSLISQWHEEYLRDPDNAFRGKGNTYKPSAKVAEYERLVGQLYAENALLKKVLKALEQRLQEERKRPIRR